MMKRLIAVVLLLSVMFSIFTVFASAESRANDYISYCNAQASAGNSRGKLNVWYSIDAAIMTVTTIGISQISVYHANGTFYKRLSGSTSNGLLKTGICSTSGTYVIQCEPSMSYYCEVEFVVQSAGGRSTRSVTTGVVKTPA